LDPLLVALQLVGNLRIRPREQIGVVPRVVPELHLLVGHEWLHDVDERRP
jgi:hypothetical protein